MTPSEVTSAMVNKYLLYIRCHECDSILLKCYKKTKLKISFVKKTKLFLEKHNEPPEHCNDCHTFYCNMCAKDKLKTCFSCKVRLTYCKQCYLKGKGFNTCKDCHWKLVELENNFTLVHSNQGYFSGYVFIPK